MRTSQSQFEVMVDFMERHGDIHKPGLGPQGRLATIAKWEELVEVLNMDPTGCPRAVDKWKKVWSDFKNNTKRKAAKIYQGASGTGGGPACTLVLNDVEQRVLHLVGRQAATGLVGVPEPGLYHVSVEAGDVVPSRLQPNEEVVIEIVPEQAPRAITPFQAILVQQPEVPTQESAQSPPAPRQVARLPRRRRHDSSASPPTPPEVPTQESAQSPPAPRQAAPRLPRRRRHDSSASPPQLRRNGAGTVSPRSRPRRRTLLHSRRADTAAERFLRADEGWRQIATEFVAQGAQQQAQWQTLFARGLDLLERFLNRF